MTTRSPSIDHQEGRPLQLNSLAGVFDRVRNGRDWMAPIRAEIAVADREVVEQAILWFTATIPDFAPVPGRPDRVILTAAGYRLGPWGDAIPNSDPRLEPSDVG